MKHVLSLAFGLPLLFFFLSSTVCAQADPPDMNFGNVAPETFAPADPPAEYARMVRFSHLVDREANRQLVFVKK